MQNIEEQIQNIPNDPGVYLFYDEDNTLLYVGKATSLKNRVRSYWQNSNKTARDVLRPIEEMIEKVGEIDYRETDSALEAIILEAEYIKKYQPKYNVLGKDNKSWNYIVFTNEDYPQVETIRQHEFKQLSKEEKENKFKEVFGPYPKLNTKAALKILRRLFQFSTCQDKKRTEENKPCLYYQMGECLGVCTEEISPKEYDKKVIQPLKQFLEGGKKNLLEKLEQDMEQASENKEYEEAARIRDQIEALDRIHDIALLNESFVEDAMSINKLNIDRIEGYDVSNLGKTGMVGSMVVFSGGEPNKSQYRKFKIKDVEEQSDVDCMKEILSRRVAHIGKEDGFAKAAPDLLIIDGGRPQINTVKEVLKENNIDVPVVGIAKGPDRDKNEFIIEGLSTEIIKWIRDYQKLLIQVRNEAHRFALKYQKKLREKRLEE